MFSEKDPPAIESGFKPRYLVDVLLHHLGGLIEPVLRLVGPENPLDLVLHEHKIPSSQIKEQTTVVFASDLHLCPKYFDHKAVSNLFEVLQGRMIEARNPILVFGGDFVNERYSEKFEATPPELFGHFVEALGKLMEDCPDLKVLRVTGDHDLENSNWSQYDQVLSNLGVLPIDYGTYVDHKLGLQIVGFPNWKTIKDDPTLTDLALARLIERPTDLATIVVAHDPRIRKVLGTNTIRFDTMIELSGHTHLGQHKPNFLGTLLNIAGAASIGIHPSYLRHLVRTNKHLKIISGGLGRAPISLRRTANPAVEIITLTPEDES